MTSSRRCSSAGRARTSSATPSTTSAINGGNLPFAAALAFVSIAIMGVYLFARALRPARSTRCEALGTSPGARWRSSASLVVVFLIAPLLRHHPLRLRQVERPDLPDPRTGHAPWFRVAWNDPAVRSALWLSVKAGVAGHAHRAGPGDAGRVRHPPLPLLRPRHRVACCSSCRSPCRASSPASPCRARSASSGIPFSLYTIIIGHATFCIVVVYNNVVARLRRTSHVADRGVARPRGDAGPDLPASDHPDAVAPRSSPGALLAFALSFDEVIVTTFTAGAQNTLPLWIFGAIRLGQQLPEVNAVVTFVLVLTLVPIAYAARISSGEGLRRTMG